MYRIFYLMNNRYDMKHCTRDRVNWYIRNLEAQGATIRSITDEYGRECKKEDF